MTLKTTKTPGRMSSPPRVATTGALSQAWANENAEARAARLRGDLAGEWAHLERARILTQPMALRQVRTHHDGEEALR